MNTQVLAEPTCPGKFWFSRYEGKGIKWAGQLTDGVILGYVVQHLVLWILMKLTENILEINVCPSFRLKL